MWLISIDIFTYLWLIIGELSNGDYGFREWWVDPIACYIVIIVVGIDELKVDTFTYFLYCDHRNEGMIW